MDISTKLSIQENINHLIQKRKENVLQKENEELKKEIYNFREKQKEITALTQLSVEDRKKVASANGKKSGEKRSVQAKIKILAELNIMESFEMKITSISLSERSGTNKRTVLKYLQELGYKEVSRKEGWKKK